MPNVNQMSIARLLAKTGSCATCMRQSLEAAICAWILLAVVVFYYPGGALQFGIETLASALSLLWLTHVATYAARSLKKSRVSGDRPGAKLSANTYSASLPRRNAVRLLLRAAAVGAAVSLPLILRPSAALAFCGQCSSNSECGVSPCHCTNTAGPGQPACNECKC